ncbi:MAG TPA: signal peptide peptidase SppA [Spirochaetota bacterium]|nr:signal peptide peptidase SppA [Spirochaetota bacterium]
MKKIYILVLSMIITASAEAAERYRYYLPPSALSAGYSQGAFSSLANPVFTQGENYPFLAYSFLREDEGEWNHFASLNLFDFDMVYSRYNGILTGLTDEDETSVSQYTVSRGFLMGNVFGFGLGYSYTLSDYSDFDSCSGWHLGFILRPVWYISAGAVFRSIEDRSFEENRLKSATYSASLRPFTEYITLSADSTIYDSKSGLDNLYTFGLEITGPGGITFNLKGDTDENYTFGLTVPFSSRGGGGPLLTKLEGYRGANSDVSDFYSGGISFTAARDKNSLNGSAAARPLYLRLSDNYSRENPPQRFFSQRENCFHHLLAGIRRASCDSTINSLIIDIDNTSLGLAQMQELRNEILKLKKSGKKAYALMSYTGNSEYYLATSADKIYFTPNSTFSITGLQMKLYFIRGLMDRAGVKFESVSRGKYKSFNETFTREKMSPAARENMEEILKDLNGQFITAITEGRKIPAEKVDKLFSAGFYTPEQAKEKGFIDEIMHRENAVEELSKDTGTVKFENYLEENERSTTWGPLPEIAVIHVTGNIVSGKGNSSSVSSSTGDYDYREALEKAFTSNSVKGVVIRVDSGGGSAAASDYMWNHLLLMKKKHPKPVVFSFGNMAASGGYYIACTGDRIFASKGTITGSIGVVAGKISLKELYSKLGISTETVKMSKFADAFSESRDLTDEEKKLFQDNIDFIYDRFTGRVIEGRKIDAAEIAKVAEGKVHTGKAAAENGLADENNGLMAAIDYAAEKGGIDKTFNVIHLPEQGGYLRGLMRSSTESALGKNIGVILKAAEKYSYPDERILYMNPYIIEIE